MNRAERRRKSGELHKAEGVADTSITPFFPEEPKTTGDYDQDPKMFGFST